MAIELEPIDSIRITILIDNLTDPLLVDQAGVKRVNWPRALTGALPTADARVSPQTGVPDALIAEPGFSALVRVQTGGRERTLLFDTGVSPNGMAENMRRLGIDARRDRGGRAQPRALGSRDRDGGPGPRARPDPPAGDDPPRVLEPPADPLPGLEPAELPATSRTSLEGMGFAIVEERQPSFLLDGAVLITGEVDRTTPFETGFQGHQALRDGTWQDDPLILDDQALVVRVRDRGLVVLTGCGHAGIVNTVRHVRRLTGEDTIAGILGGFHLSGPMFEPIIEPTVEAFAELDPALLAPAHCTGWKAVHRLAARFPDAFVLSTVGTTIEI